MRPPVLGLRPDVAPAQHGKLSIAAAVGNALQLPNALKQITEQQARLRMVPVPGLKEALSNPSEATPDKPDPDAAQPVQSAEFLYELGLTFVALGNNTAAIGALRRVTELEPRFAAAWQKLGDLLKQSGDAVAAEAAAASCRDCASDDLKRPGGKLPATAKLQAPKLLAMERHLAKRIMEGPPEEAGALLRKHLRNSPTDVAALRILAEIGARNGHFAAAELLLERAVGLAPGYVTARRDYAGVLSAQNKHVLALPHLEWLLQQEPRNALHRMLLALCLGSIGDYDRSLALYEGVIGDVLQQPKFLLNYAHVLKYAGRRADSVRTYRACLEVSPSTGEAWWSLANIKNERFSEADIDAMRAQLASVTVPLQDRINLHYALGSALEQAGAYADSFAQYSKGAALKHAEFPYKADDLSNQVQQMKAFFTASRFAACTGWGHADPAPIFILGMPRAGSTLIEQILASHSAVEGTRELPEIANIARDIGAARDTASALAELGRDDAAALGASFIDKTQIYRRTGKPFFIDKMPSNWAQVGLIHLILPNAKIIDARRHPMASCFSNFKQLFGSGANYTYDLTALGRFYTDYVEWMAHVDAVLPGRVHRVIYENMVADSENETRRLLDYCGLPFEPACLRFWESQRAVATPSSEQVRQPIFREGLEQWRNYEAWLGPLAKALSRPGSLPWDA